MASASDHRAHAALQPADCLILLPQRLPAAVETSIGPAHYPAECTQSDAFLQPSLRARYGRANSNSFFGYPEELLDPQMLLDPLEEQLDLPSALVEGADGRGRQTELIGEEHQGFPRLGIAQPDAPQVLGVMLAGVVTVERDGLIADDPRRPVGRGRIDAMGIHVRFGAGDEEGAGEMQPMEAGEIDVAAIHDVDGARFREQQVESVDVVQLAVRNVDEARDVAA